MAHDFNEYRVLDKNHDSSQRKPKRLLYFLSAFLPLLAGSQIYVFSQPAIYRSEATVLTTAATDIDEVSQDADLQHVNIQKDLLLGQGILDKTAAQLNASSDELRGMFAVTPVSETNLLKLTAEGHDPQFLQKAVNAWIAAYLQARSEYVTEISDKLTNTIKNELQRIDQQVDAKRQEIDQFRLANNIQSADSVDNQAHARLQGLNESLNKAMEEEVLAKAKMDAIHNAIKQGKAVVPEADSHTLAAMTEQAGKLQEKLDALRGNYTDEYIRFNPTMRKIPEQLADLQAKINEKLKSGGGIAAQEAENNYAAAQEAVQVIQAQMTQHKKVAAEYTSEFAKLQAMTQELAAMETLQNDTKERLVDIEVKQRQKYPQVEIIDSATLPTHSIRPNYLQEAAIGFAASLLTGLLFIWIIDFLRREDSKPQQNSLHVQLNATPAGGFLPDMNAAVALEGYNRQPAISPAAAPSLGYEGGDRELAQQEVVSLFANADLQLTEILSLLLNGLSAGEITALSAESFNTEKQTITVADDGRTLPMNRYTAVLLSAYPWQAIEMSPADIDALLSCAAIDAGLTAPEQIGAGTLSYTYTLFLIRQGVRLGDLPKIIGPVSPGNLILLGKYSPVSAGLSLDKIDLNYMPTA
ncbi:MAG: hypothetical protein PHW13_11745 [Methylococcales bacterium]|nr:hypothetical protein [Methylococcales bacterium]